MIRNDAEYNEALRRIVEDEAYIAEQRRALEAEGYAADDVEYGLGPMLSFHAQLVEVKEWYERVRRGQIAPITGITGIGRLLIAARIALGLTQRQLAERLGVSEAQVSKDERNEYHGVNVEKVQRIFNALGVKTSTRVLIEPGQVDARELVHA